MSSLYRPPNDGNFLEKFEGMLQRLEPDKEVYVLGDFNIDYSNRGSFLCRGYVALLSLFNLKQIILKPTRVTDVSSTVLDHILTNSAGKINNSGVFDFGLSDHLPVFCSRYKDRGGNFGQAIKWCRTFRNYSPEIFRRELRAVDWSLVYLAPSVDEAYGYLIGILREVTDRLAPLRQIRVKQRTEPWMTGDIICGIKRRDSLFSLFKRDRSNRDVYREFCSVRNKVQRDVKLAKQVYFKGVIERSEGDSSKLWRNLKLSGFASKGKSGARIVLDVNGAKCFEAGNVAGQFNTFYSRVASNLVRSLPLPRGLFSAASEAFAQFYRERGVRHDSFRLSPVRTRFVFDQLSCLKLGKSTGLDGISTRFLRDGAEILAGPMCHIVNLSMTSEVVPSLMKDARVTPVFKKGSRLDCGNYRPVSILNVLSKVLERAVHAQFVSYLSKRGVLTEFQSGFRPGFSADTCLLGLSDFVRREMSKGKLVGLVLLDLQKAFDCVDHEILLDKLGKMGVGSLDWFRSYLSGRRQCVIVDGVLSEFSPVDCGVPQGSILGPILFLCYVNDMSISLGCHLSLYADDSTLVASGENPTELGEYLSDQLARCRDWMVDNKLSLHLGKTECILIGSEKRLSSAQGFRVLCDGSEVKRVDCVRYLGVMLDGKFKGKAQAMSVIKKVASRLGFLYRSAPLLDFYSRKVLCMSLIQPCMDFCISSWYVGLSGELKERLDVLQRKMVRYIYGWGPRGHVGSATFRELGWLQISDRVRYFALLHAFKIRKGLAPSYLLRGFVRVSVVHSHHTRASGHGFHISRDDVPGGFAYFAKVQWNELPVQLQSIDSEAIFRVKVRRYLMRGY